MWGGFALVSASIARYCIIPVLVFLFTVPQQAFAVTLMEQLRAQAAQFEQQADWDNACQCYEAMLRTDRAMADIKERYQHCLRRYWQARRHQDHSYRKEVLSLDYGQALQLYRAFLTTLHEHSLDGKRLTFERMFRKGLEELQWALGEPTFVQTHLPMAKPADIDAFVDSLQVWDMIEVTSQAMALKQVREIALSAYTHLHLNCNTVIMEFSCGACYAVDDYTAYLTPTQLRALCDSLKGQVVGVGLVPSNMGNRVIVEDVTPTSAAADIMPPLQRGDQILSIDGKSTDFLSAETVLTLLEGAENTTVELKIDSPSMGERVITLQRRPIFMPSVAYHMKDEVTGYLQIVCFQQSTLQELDAALQSLSKARMKVLILDLRGNVGGLFDSAVESARRFLTNGMIASTRHSDPRQNAVYHSRNAEAVTVPMVVLIDGDTASAAEVLAGALKDNRRARLIGQTTFGKGCTQCVLQLPAGKGNVPTGGMRLTVSQFFSPKGQPYTGRGVTPHLAIARLLMPQSMANDVQAEEAHIEARRMLGATSH